LFEYLIKLSFCSSDNVPLKIYGGRARHSFADQFSTSSKERAFPLSLIISVRIYFGRFLYGTSNGRSSGI
jgi:hypothetical protein